MLPVCEHMLDSVAWLPLTIVIFMGNIYLETDNDSGLFSLSLLLVTIFLSLTMGLFKNKGKYHALIWSYL